MKPMNQKQIPTSQNQIPNNMKPMKQKLILSSKISSLAVFLLLPMSSYAALTAWKTNPILEGDKLYTWISSSANLDAAASVAATESAGVHSFNLSDLGSISTPGSFVRYSINITDPGNFFYLNRVSENDPLGNSTGGSTTTVFSDLGFSTVLNSTTLVGTGTGPTFTTGPLQWVWVQTTINGVDAGTNKISNVTFDVTQTSAIPEVTSSFSLLAMLSSGLLLRRRTKS
jgi:hypothetical protein